MMGAITQMTFVNAFVNEKLWLLTKMSMKIVSKGPIDKNPALV